MVTVARTTTRAWLELDLSRATGETRYEAEMERRLVRFEHSGEEGSDIECVNPECDDWMQYRPTVGAMQCPSCHSLANRNGDAIRIGS